MLEKIQYKKELLLLFVVHLAGIIGIKSMYSDFFLQLSFISLLIPLFIVVFRMKIAPKSFFLLIAVYGFGFFAEWLGVNGGYVFGDYIYGNSLGYKVGGVPLLIGVNWLLLTIVSREIALKYFSSPLAIVFSAASIMLAIDIVIEPIAHKLDFWTWNGNSIPLSNYRDWFFIAIVNQFIFLFLKSQYKVFGLALGYVIILVLFFCFFY